MKPYIPHPCHEDWNAMTDSETSEERGRHCDVCSKVVVDFTKMSDAEMIDYLQQHSKQKICGHFRNEQLYQAEKIEINLASIPTNLSFRKYFAIALLIAFTSFGLVSCKSNSGKTVGEIEVVDSVHSTQQNLIDSNFKEGEITYSDDSVKSNVISTKKVTIDTLSIVTMGDVCIKPNDDKKNIKPIQKKTKGKIEIKSIQQEDIIQSQTTTGIMIPPDEVIQK
ncbi:MAG: hypothetical protein IPL21_08530 [Saprospirales bacterium]|nr:hypothetical protein [Saprospirales bacterium]